MDGNADNAREQQLGWQAKVTNERQLDSELHAYSKWRAELNESVLSLSLFLKNNQITDLRTHHQLELVLGALSDDKLSIAFVAEFSRGKSEMINTMFFGGYQRRILPSGAGRTTMCPTEVMYDAHQKTAIRLLPIETRTLGKPLHELKQEESIWNEIEFDADDPESIAAALSGMTDSKLVSKDYANRLRFNTSAQTNSDYGLPLNEYDEVEIPCWRHAIINIPHPLLKEGLVILDTPGLNAIGAELELTIDQLAAAHAIVFILSHDTGVTQTDLALWEHHLGGKMDVADDDAKTSDVLPARESIRKNQRRLVALNKIDTLWDGIRSDSEIQAELDRQVWQTAKTLGIDPQNIFPVSAQKGLLGRLQQDEDLVDRSGVPELEAAISDRLVPYKRLIVSDKVRSSLNGILDTASSIIDNRLADNNSHIIELRQISSKNTDVISHIMLKVTSEKSSLEEDMKRYQALNSVYSKETQRLIDILSQDRLERLIAVTKHNMTRCASSITLQKTITLYFEKMHRYLDQAMHQANEIAVLSETITRNFEHDHGISNFHLRRLRLEKFKQEIARLEQKYSHLKDTKTLFFREQMSITNRFYQSVCTASRKIFGRALRDANAWNSNLMVPMETYVREHHSQLRRRLESVKRIHKATDTVETRLQELELQNNELKEQQEEFMKLQHRLTKALTTPEAAQKNESSTAKEASSSLYWDHRINF